MFRYRSAVAAIAACMSLAAPAFAGDAQLGALRINHPWIVAPPPGAPTAAGYFSITNGGRAPDRLLSGESADFARVELHQMTMTGSVMRMRPITGGVVIAPGQTVSLSPDDERHLMLVGPKRTIKAIDHVAITLRFERAGTVKVVFDVQPMPMSAKSGTGMR
jgi:copper(I)-binding protein